MGITSDLAGLSGSILGNPLDTLETLASLTNPVTMATASFSATTTLFDQMAGEFFKQQEGSRPGRRDCRDKGEGKGDSGCEGSGGAGGGGSIFEQIALAMGEAMDNKLQQLLQAADKVAELSSQLADKQENGTATEADKTRGQGDIMTASAQVTARSQELNTISQAFNSSINAVGQAASTAASKR